jgi:hypothetical protein
VLEGIILIIRLSVLFAPLDVLYVKMNIFVKCVKVVMYYKVQVVHKNVSNVMSNATHVTIFHIDVKYVLLVILKEDGTV